MAYKYEVFFSYKRDAESDGWHKTVMEKLRFWLKQELNQLEVSVFFDTEEIHSGARWQTKLSEALRTSKVMICVWSPLYFQSQWCVSEWKTFAARERQCGKDLIVPASFHDGLYFPLEAKAKHMKDFSNYTSTAARFWQTDSAVEFERGYLRPFAEDIAAAIKSAPAFDPTFPVVEVPPQDVPPARDIGRFADD